MSTKATRFYNHTLAGVLIHCENRAEVRKALADAMRRFPKDRRELRDRAYWIGLPCNDRAFDLREVSV